MDNMYDILARMTLLEGKGKPDFLDLDKDGDRKESMKDAAKEVAESSWDDDAERFTSDQIAGDDIVSTWLEYFGDEKTPTDWLKQAAGLSPGASLYFDGNDLVLGDKNVVSDITRKMITFQQVADHLKKVAGRKKSEEVDESMDEASYSAKAARAGKDIGKPGKNFEKIAKSAAERYGSKERGEKVAGAVLAKLRAKESVEEGEVEEGNEFTGARQAAIRAGKPTFTVDGKTYRVSGDTSDEKVMEREMKDKDEFDRWANPGDTVRTAKGTLIKTASGVKHERRMDDEEDSEDSDNTAPKKRGRPKGPAKGPERVTGKAWKHKGGRKVKESELDEDYDKDEYDEEGEMALSQLRTIEDAAEELQSILDADENLPEWAQKKITLAKEYIDSARDYLAANRPKEETMMAEKAVSKAQRAAAGIAYAAKKGDIPKSELRGASKEMAKMATGELKKFAKTKEKGLPEKKKEESVEETTVAGSVATAPAESSKGKKGMQFGKGVYESKLEESYNSRLEQMLTEGMNITINANDQGQDSVSVTATEDDAAVLSDLLKMAGLFSSDGYSNVSDQGKETTCEVCGGHEGMHEAGCSGRDMVEEELANAPDTEYADTDYMINTLAGGLNGPKRQANPNNPADNPLAMGKLGKSSVNLNLGPGSAVKENAEKKLWDLYQRFDTK